MKWAKGKMGFHTVRKECVSERKDMKCSRSGYMAVVQGSTWGMLGDQVVEAAKDIWKLFNLDIMGERE